MRSCGTSWPPWVTRLATRSKLTSGFSVATKYSRTSKPFDRASRMYSTWEMCDITVSKLWLTPLARASARPVRTISCACRATSTGEPLKPFAMSSALKYLPRSTPCSRSAAIKVDLPEPFGPATTERTGTQFRLRISRVPAPRARDSGPPCCVSAFRHRSSNQFVRQHRGAPEFLYAQPFGRRVKPLEHLIMKKQTLPCDGVYPFQSQKQRQSPAPAGESGERFIVR